MAWTMSGKRQPIAAGATGDGPLRTSSPSPDGAADAAARLGRARGLQPPAPAAPAAGDGRAGLVGRRPRRRGRDHARHAAARTRAPPATSGRCRSSTTGAAANVVLVARTHASGLKAAQEALRDWAAGDLPVKLLGLVLIADAPGRLPKPLRDLAQLVAGGAPTVWRIPWHEPWRRGEPVEPVEAPAAIRSLLEELEELVPTVRSPAAARDARRITTSNARSSQCLISSPSRALNLLAQAPSRHVPAASGRREAHGRSSAGRPGSPSASASSA